MSDKSQGGLSHVPTLQGLTHSLTEGNLIIGERNQTALITLIERVSRTQVVLDLPDGHRSAPTCARLDAWIATTRAASSARSRGTAAQRWPTGPGSPPRGTSTSTSRTPTPPWQRRANENGNRQLRFWLPKGTDLSIHGKGTSTASATSSTPSPAGHSHWQSPNQAYAAQTAH